MSKKVSIKEFYDGLVAEKSVNFDVAFSLDPGSEFKIVNFGSDKDLAFDFAQAQPCSFIVRHSLIHSKGLGHE